MGAFEQYMVNAAKIDADSTKKRASASASYADELGDIDVWAAQTAANDAKDAVNKSYGALSMAGNRTVGGGTFNSLVSGRGRINLGGLSGGLSAANAAKLADTKKKDAAGDLAAQQSYITTASAADKNAAEVERVYGAAAQEDAMTAAQPVYDANGRLQGYRKIDKLSGQLMYSPTGNGGWVPG